MSLDHNGSDLDLEAILNHYLRLANSGDAGFWDPETEDEVIAARKALAEDKGE